MNSTIRKFKVLGMLSLPLAAIALAVFLLSGGTGSTQQAHAVTGPDLSLSSAACIGGAATTVNGVLTTPCSITGGSTFTVSFNVKKIAVNYSGYDLAVIYAGSVNYKVNSLVQPASNGVGCAATGTSTCFYNESAGGDKVFNTGTPKVGNAGELGNGEMDTFGAQSTGNPQTSSYTGSVATMQFVCKSTGTGTITLKSGAGNTDLSPGGAEAADEALAITCKVAPTATPVPPTATPPSIPRVFKTCTEPNALGTPVPATSCNVFLTRQGNKIPPTTCAAGTSGILLNEKINIPVATGSKYGPQTLGAFQFEVRFDSKDVCVFLAAAGDFALANHICTIRDDASMLQLKGIAQIGCVTIGKGHTGSNLNLATITVKAQPEVFSQLRPNQANGVTVQILNQGCNLSDEQGIVIPIFSCEDADLTFRYLEGDVQGPDCKVDALDAQNIAFRWGADKGSLLFNSFMDLSPSGHGVNGDGHIDIQDLQFVFGRLGSTGYRQKGSTGPCPITGTPWPAQLPVNPKA